MVNFIDYNDLQALYIAIKHNKNITLNEQTDNLFTSFLFTKQYVNKIDRTMAYFIYENNFVQ